MEGEMFNNCVPDNYDVDDDGDGGDGDAVGLEMRRGWEDEKSSDDDSLLAWLRLGKEKSISCDDSDVDEEDEEGNPIAIGYSTLNDSPSSSMSSNNEIFLSDSDGDSAENDRLLSCILSDSSSSYDNHHDINTPVFQ
eukprot:gene5498-6053_t